MERNLLAWNFPNWITVMLMAAAGYLVLAGVAQAFKQQGASSNG